MEKIKQAYFELFIEKMKERLESGEKKYGTFKYMQEDQVKDIEEELLDVANYALLLALRVQLQKSRFEKDVCQVCKTKRHLTIEYK